MIKDRLHQIREKIQTFQQKSQKLQINHSTINSEIKLLAVSKKFGIDAVLEAVAANQFAFAENYLQEGMEKIQNLETEYPEIAKNLEWHFIGQAQSNKCKYLVKYFSWVQTVDDIEFAKKLNHEAEKYFIKNNINVDINKKINICLQINLDQSTQKNGLKPEQIKTVLDYILNNCPHLKFRGLMLITDIHQPEDLLKIFQQARLIFENLQETYPNEAIDTLSMGMSQDMEQAIQAGTTMLRVGQAIFGARL